MLRKCSALLATSAVLMACGESGPSESSGVESPGRSAAALTSEDVQVDVYTEWATGYCANVVHLDPPNDGSFWTVEIDVGDSQVYTSWNGTFDTTASPMSVTGQWGNPSFCANKTGPNWEPEVAGDPGPDPGPGALPDGILATDIGSPGVSGSTSHADGVFSLSGSGDGIEGTADEFHFLSGVLQGDGEVTVRIDSLTSADPSATVGVMLRQEASVGSPNAFFGMRPRDTQPNGSPGPLAGSMVQHRSTTGGGTTTTFQNDPPGDPDARHPTLHGVRYLSVPKWLKLVREGDNVAAYSADDGQCWTLRWEVDVDFTQSGVLAGVALASGDSNVLASAEASSLSISTGVPSDVNADCDRAERDGDIPPPSQWVVAPQAFGASQWSFTTSDPNGQVRPASCIQGGDLERRRFGLDDPICPADELLPGGWGHVGFDASGWSTGPGGFGPSTDPGVSTTVNSDSFWIRREFNLTAQQIPELMFWGRFPFGVSIYVNGVLATTTHESTLNGRYHYLGMNDAARAALQVGTNVVAVRVQGGFVDLGLGLNGALAQPNRVVNAAGTQYEAHADAFFEFSKEMGAIGGVFAVQKNGTVVNSESFGYTDRSFQTDLQPDAILRLASVDKAVTQAALIQAFEDDLLDPDDHVFGDVLTLAPVPGGAQGARVDQITMEHLRTHTGLVSRIGGKQHYQDEVAFRFGVTAEELTGEHLARLLFSSDTVCIDGECTPGEAHEYSSNGYFLIRYAIEQRLQALNPPLTFEEYLAQTLGANDIVIASERLAGRPVNEPGYVTIDEPTRSRWFELEEYLALSASAPGLLDLFTTYAASYDYDASTSTYSPKAGGGGGSMAGTRAALGVDPVQQFGMTFIWNTDLPRERRLDEKLAMIDNGLNAGSCDPREFPSNGYRINSFWAWDQYLHVENEDNGNPTFEVLTGEPESSWVSARWMFVPIQDGADTFYLIRNEWNDNRLLHLGTGTLSAIGANANDPTAQWILDDSGTYFRIHNRAQPARYINIENGTLQATDLGEWAHSTRWYICN